jgi:hypothetical protein
MRICLKIPDDAVPALRARLNYAFRLFCAIYGHVPVVDPVNGGNADVKLRYVQLSSRTPSAPEPTVWLSRGYRARRLRDPAPPPVKYAGAGITTLLHHAPTGEYAPDWLGEIFEWVSCADEYSVCAHDQVGRPLFAATYAGRYNIDTLIPYAAIAMRSLQQAICQVLPGAPLAPRSPDGAPSHLVIPTHDVDYLPVSRWRAVDRLLRNAVCSSVVANRSSLGVRQLGMALRTALGGRFEPLNQIVQLAEEESRRGFRASYYFLTRHAHRRDAFYTLENSAVLKLIHWLELRGMEVGIHGSYTCMDHEDGLHREVANLNNHGIYPEGGRQHWLRYTLDRLIPAMERAKLSYDTSIGWADRIGFRAGACFAFPPYNFGTESAASFLEIPMVVMDQALEPRHDGLEKMLEQATTVLAASREMGWGGISLLWHPSAFGDGWLPSGVGDTFWTLADTRDRCRDVWIKASDFMERVRQRYAIAGLLPTSEGSAFVTTLEKSGSIDAPDSVSKELLSASLGTHRAR